MNAIRTRIDAPVEVNVKELHELIDPIEDHNLRIYKAAVWYAENGISIIPFMPKGYPSGMSQRHATHSVNKIRDWFHPEIGKFPGAVIAMAHGGQAGFCAIDLDRKAGVDGIENLADLQMSYGLYDDSEGKGLQTLMAVTPSGGRHLVFQYHPEIISNSEACYPGIDTRGGLKKNPIINGGITFVEPSRKPSGGGIYRWDESIMQIAEIPQWLVDVLNRRTPPKSSSIQLQDSYVQSAPGTHGDGRDRNIYCDLLRFVGIGYKKEDLWKLLPQILERMNPPDEDMVRKKIESVLNSDVFKKAEDKSKVEDQTQTLDLVKNKDGKIIKCAENLSIILDWAVFKHEYGIIEFDDFSYRFVRDKNPMDSVANWAVGIQLWISKKLKIDFSVVAIREMVEHLAYAEQPHINVARDYMLNCPRPPELGVDDFWGSGRSGPGENFKRLCVEVLSLNKANLHTDYCPEVRDAYMAFLWFWLQGVVARACVPGCKMEIVLNIFGDQGIGKSLFFRCLCPNPSWFTDSIQDSIAGGAFNNRDELLKLHAKVIVEMPELSPIKKGGKSSDNKMKQFISAQVDNFRRAYGHDSMDHKRTCALCGTSNEVDVYRDSSGDRRFVSINHSDVPIKVGDQDNGVLREIRDKLWGEVVASFKNNELLENGESMLVAIPPRLRRCQGEINNSHRFEEIGIAEVIEWMQDKTRITWLEIITHSKSVPGLRDAKESMIMFMIRKELFHDKLFLLKIGITITNEKGERERASRAWVNMKLDLEIQHRAGLPVPPHWSSYTKSQEISEF